LPNVGKSTLFSALTRRQVPRENYPFCTIEPNVGCVEVPDPRLLKLAEIEHSQKIIYATVNFVDIAGLVAGAHKGEGLGNKFLSHIRETDAIAMVVRVFEDENVAHVAGKIDPLRDIEIIEMELALADLAAVSKKIEVLAPKAKAQDKQAIFELNIYKKIEEALNAQIPVRKLEFSPEEQTLVNQLFLLTAKAILYILNISDAQISEREKIRADFAKKLNVAETQIIPISAKIETEIAELPREEAQEILKSYNLSHSALDEIILAAYKTLDLISFLTAGEKEARAWTIKKGFTAPEAAGEIHTDFQNKFVKADVVSFEDFVGAPGWVQAAQKGLVRSEGKDYIFQDGDVVFFKHG